MTRHIFLLLLCLTMGSTVLWAQGNLSTAPNKKFSMASASRGASQMSSGRQKQAKAIVSGESRQTPSAKLGRGKSSGGGSINSFSRGPSRTAASTPHATPRTHFGSFTEYIRKINSQSAPLKGLLRTSGKEVYCSQVIPILGWMEGVSLPLTIDEVRKLPMAYRLSQPDADGHWQLVEALSYGRPSSAHGLTTPLSDCYAATPEARRWQELAGSAAIWRFSADPDGQLALIRAYRTDGELAYTLHAASSADGRLSRTCFFTDSSGLPVDVNPDPNYHYGSVFRVLSDNLGRDSLITFLDAQGYLKPRPDGVWQLRLDYSGFHFRSDTALDFAGQQMNRLTAQGQPAFCTRRFIPSGSIAAILHSVPDFITVEYTDKHNRKVATSRVVQP